MDRNNNDPLHLFHMDRLVTDGALLGSANTWCKESVRVDTRRIDALPVEIHEIFFCEIAFFINFSKQYTLCKMNMSHINCVVIVCIHTQQCISVLYMKGIRTHLHRLSVSG